MTTAAYGVSRGAGPVWPMKCRVGYLVEPEGRYRERRKFMGSDWVLCSLRGVLFHPPPMECRLGSTVVTSTVRNAAAFVFPAGSCGHHGEIAARRGAALAMGGCKAMATISTPLAHFGSSLLERMRPPLEVLRAARTLVGRRVVEEGKRWKKGGMINKIVSYTMNVRKLFVLDVIISGYHLMSSIKIDGYVKNYGCNRFRI